MILPAVLSTNTMTTASPTAVSLPLPLPSSSLSAGAGAAAMTAITNTNIETKINTALNKSHGRNLGHDHGGCPHEVEVPGFISAPFLHFTHFLPPLPSSEVDFNSNIPLQTSREPSFALSPTPLVQHNTQVKLCTLPNASVMLSALGRPIDHIPVYRVLYQCKECSALFST